MMRSTCYSGLVALGMLLVACAGGENSAADDSIGESRTLTDPSAIAARMDSLRVEIRERVGTPAAEEGASCRAIPLGAKPCGGPRSYLVFSTAATDSASLDTLVREYNRLDRRLNELEGRISDCMLVTEPSLTVENAVCTAVR